MSANLSFAPLLDSFFRSRLTKQRNASPSTVASYRDALRMLACRRQVTTAMSKARIVARWPTRAEIPQSSPRRSAASLPRSSAAEIRS
jgi:hypothetical protein